MVKPTYFSLKNNYLELVLQFLQKCIMVSVITGGKIVNISVRLKKRTGASLKTLLGLFQYILVVLAEDGHGNEVDPPMEIHVVVEDVNDNSPVCGEDESVFEVQEDEPMGKICVDISVYSIIHRVLCSIPLHAVKHDKPACRKVSSVLFGQSISSTLANGIPFPFFSASLCAVSFYCFWSLTGFCGPRQPNRNTSGP